MKKLKVIAFSRNDAKEIVPVMLIIIITMDNIHRDAEL